MDALRRWCGLCADCVNGRTAQVVWTGLNGRTAQVVRGSELSDLDGWKRSLREENVSLPPSAFEHLPTSYRRVRRTGAIHEPCLPGAGCAPISFTYGTLPIRPFTGGHTWFNQNVQEMAGHELPQHEPITVHFTFQ